MPAALFPRASLRPAAALALIVAASPIGGLAAQDADGDADAEAADEAAQPKPSEAGGLTTRSTFTPDDFARFAPRNAFDMARNVPGFSIRGGDGARGLGAADTNVLVNSRRIAGKANGPIETLRRIPVKDVVRLELVDGASLGIGGLTGQVLNVVTSASGRVTGQFRYQPEIRSFGTPARLLDASAALAGGGRKSEWTLQLRNDSMRRGNEGPEQAFDGAGNLVALRDEKANYDSDRLALTGSYARTADNGNILNLTGQIGGFLFRESEISLQRAADGPLQRTRDLKRTEDAFNFEVGVDYEFIFGPGRLKLIGYGRSEDSPSANTVVTTFPGAGTPQGSVFLRDSDESETVLRAEYKLNAGGGNLVAALEGARNTLAITSSLAERDALGNLQPVIFAGSSAEVAENRADARLTWSRALAAGLQMQVSAGGEYSTISQSGPFGLTRSFWRPKGFVALDWKVTPSLNLAGRIERVVGQLEFADFIASVDVDQDRTNASNANLRPEQSWVFDLEASWRMGKLGNITVSGFYEWLTDVVDQIPLPGGGQAPGNIASAKLYGMEGKATLLSDGIGWRGTRADLSASWSNSAVRDPLLGTLREISGNELFSTEFRLRHDIPDTPWAFGLRGDWQKVAQAVRLDEISLNNPSFAQMLAFAEHKNVLGLTVRARVGNLLDQKDRFARTVFADRAAGRVALRESRERRFGTIVSFDIEGSF
jgi:hypothetical protein